MNGNGFGEILQETLAILTGKVAKLNEDGELDDADLDTITGCLETISSAIECYIAQKEEACQVAAHQGRESRTEI